MTQIEDDPEQQLADAQRAIQVKIAATKNLISASKKELSAANKLPLEAHPDKPQRVDAVTKKIELLQVSLFELESDLKDLTRTKDDETEEKIQAALHSVRTNIIETNNSVAYIISDDRFISIKDYSCSRGAQNVVIDKFEPSVFVKHVANITKLKSWHLPIPRVIDLFNSVDRSFTHSRFTINTVNWDKDVYKPIEHMRNYFIDKLQLTADEDEFATDSVHYFDWLMYSLSGGKQENKEHLERWIVHKIINYHKAVTTPDVIVVGHVGGNGKGIIQAIIRIMLPAILSGNANTKTLTNNFNAIMLGKLIVFFDDQVSKEIPLDVVKQLAGSETMIFEEKGKDQFNGEKTHSSAWFAQQLPFRLTPAGQEGGVDRRFSVMRTNITFLESIRKHMLESTGVAISVEDSKDHAEVIVSNVLLNRICIAKWFQTLLQKYPDINSDYSLKALHGQDYHYFLDQQKDRLEEIFKDLIKPVIENGGAVPIFVIREIIRLSNETIPHQITLKKKLSELASQNKIELVFGRRFVEIMSNTSITKMQASAITMKGNTVAVPAFDWSLVSSKAFKKPGKGEDYINDEDFIFGVKTVSDDPDDMGDLFGEDETEAAVEDAAPLNEQPVVEEVVQQDTNNQTQAAIAVREFIKNRRR